MWRTVTPQDIQAHAFDERIAAAVRSTLGAGDESTFAVLRDPVVARIRARIASWPDHTLDTRSGTIPPEFHDYACLVILSLLLSRPGTAGAADSNTFTLTSDQRDRLKQAEADLAQVAKGELAVTPFDSQEEVSRTIPVPSIGTRTRTYGRDYEDGL